ncbi:MAG: LemA family protein [Cyclobacteriaceae bacterium]|nr:LemA family protein [Cytophagales bacterium]MBX2901024.1 LemA family protein [Cyclobacteriaceae bacterium]
MIPTLIAIAIALLLAIIVIVIYNKIAKAKVLTEEGWSGIGTFLQQRANVILNLVEVVKGFAGHENKTLTDVIKARNESISALTPEAQIAAAQHLSTALLNFKSLTEHYPELKANENFLRLQSQVDEMEEKINQSRRYYNGTARAYNQLRVVFPNILVANAFGFKPVPFFQEDESARIAPQIKF